MARQLGSWGNYPRITTTTHTFESAESLRALLGQLNGDGSIPRGLGRSYGDSALSPHLLSTRRLNRILALDEAARTISCQAGVTLAELLPILVPRGLFLPVTPGTKFVTVGGAIASDIHGKNHHSEGTFSRHLLHFDLMLASGEVVRCSPEMHPDLFWATCGGMGLTGIILNATFRLKPIESAYIRQESIRARNLDQIMDLFEESESWTYSMAWIDCLSRGASLGRSILMRGEHATLADLKHEEALRAAPLQPKARLKLTVPFTFPDFALNTLSVKAFNFLYYHKHPRGRLGTIVEYDPFFYPLDSIHHWNRIYGRRGFVQYQFVLPKAASREGLVRILRTISEEGRGSFLAVLKLFGPQEEGLISFPMEGYTLALDFAVRPGLFSFLDRLDQMVLAYGGRLYLTKDARMSAETFRRSYPTAERFLEIVRAVNPSGKLRSLQSERVGITR